MKFSCLILTLALVIGSQGKARAEMVDGIDAIVHDSIITFQEVEDATAPVADELRKQYRNQPEMFEKKVAEALKENREQLVERQLILHEFETTYTGFPESIIDEQLQERIRAQYGNRVTLTKTLQQQGMTYEKYRRNYRERFIIEQMSWKNIAGEVMISPHKIETYYVQHTNNFKVEDQVKLRMIVLNTPPGSDTAAVRKLAEEILGKINEGASFTEMASVYSQGSQRNQGGDWGWIARLDVDGKPVLRKELGDVAFALKPGEKSGLIETPEAFYLMLVEDKRAAHVKPLNEVRDEIEKILRAEEQKRLRDQWIARLKKKTFVRYFQN